MLTDFVILYRCLGLNLFTAYIKGIVCAFDYLGSVFSAIFGSLVVSKSVGAIHFI